MTHAGLAMSNEGIEPCGRATQHRLSPAEIGGEEIQVNGRLAFFHNTKCVGVLGGESTGRRSDAKTKKRFVYLDVTPKPGGGFNVEFVEVVPKNVVDELSLNKRIHSDRSLRLFEMPGKVRGERCQLITL